MLKLRNALFGLIAFSLAAPAVFAENDATYREVTRYNAYGQDRTYKVVDRSQYAHPRRGDYNDAYSGYVNRTVAPQQITYDVSSQHGVISHPAYKQTTTTTTTSLFENETEMTTHDQAEAYTVPTQYYGTPSYRSYTSNTYKTNAHVYSGYGRYSNNYHHASYDRYPRSHSYGYVSYHRPVYRSYHCAPRPYYRPYCGPRVRVGYHGHYRSHCRSGFRSGVSVYFRF